MKITFIRNSDAFCLIQNPSNSKKYKLVLVDIVLVVTRIKASKKLWEHHEKCYDAGLTAYIPVTHTSLLHKLVQPETSTIHITDLLIGGHGEIAPFKMFVCFIEHDSFAGKHSF